MNKSKKEVLNEASKTAEKVGKILDIDPIEGFIRASEEDLTPEEVANTALLILKDLLEDCESLSDSPNFDPIVELATIFSMTANSLFTVKMLIDSEEFEGGLVNGLTDEDIDELFNIKLFGSLTPDEPLTEDVPSKDEIGSLDDEEKINEFLDRILRTKKGGKQ